ncbi:class I SAM-dependent methyltransferase [Rhodococcus sp. NPDC058514]|uniref:class I SAM-dependent methyltransferase n=1 Tax=unclassified Rhodococcus (in: high G+C Gram-positive bacteria) TaxID=192944 RepID=UPI00364AA3DA
MTGQPPTAEPSGAATGRRAAILDDATTPITVGLAEHALRIVGLRAGERFLEVAAGRGTLGIPAARLGAEVVVIDAATMIDLAADSFDVVGSQDGLTRVPDLRRCLVEMVRVTKPAGRVLIVALGSPAEAEYLDYFRGAMHAVVPRSAGLAATPAAWPPLLADPAALRGAMADAGLREVSVETTTCGMRFRSGGHLWDVATSTIAEGGRLDAELSGDQRSVVRQVLDGMLRERSAGGSSAVLSIGINVGVGRKRTAAMTAD